MYQPELEKLTRAEQLFDEGNLIDALEIFKDPSQYMGLNLQQISYFQFLRGLILLYLNNGEDLINLGETIYKEGQKCNDNLQSFDGLFFIIIGLGISGKFEEAFNYFEETDSVLKSISNVSKEILTQRKVRLSVAKAFVGMYGGKVDLVERSLEWILDSQEEFDNSFEIVWANTLMASYLGRVKSNFDLFREHIKKALAIAKEIKFNHYWIALCQLYFGGYYISIGEMDKSLKYNIKGLELFKKIKSSFNIAILLNNIGNLYSEIGEYELAVENLEESMNLLEQIPKSFFSIETPIESLITLAVENGDNDRAQKYFHCLEDIYNQKRTDRIEFLYKFAKALILKTSSRIRNKAKAEELLKELIKMDTISFDVIIKAHIHLCDILLMEYYIDNDSEILGELNHYIAKLLTIAEKQHSYIVFCETFILQAKLALLNFEIKSARLFLTQAQKIAEFYSMKRLAVKISFEHDELLKRLNLWEKLKESEAPLSERWKLARLDEQIKNMVKKRKVDVTELSDEEPVLLLIVSEGGIPFFSQSFIGDKIFEDHLFSGFFTAINTFINEVFSEGLDRASFGEYTLLMNSVSPFLICYLYKGQSYSAQNRIKSFLMKIKSNKQLWDDFNKFYQMNRKIHIRDVPSLEALIQEIFIQKNLIKH
ncbi:MAG: tetratricopeptide repeat protein [Candidatus Hermodarchaeota archaeon]